MSSFPSYFSEMFTAKRPTGTKKGCCAAMPNPATLYENISKAGLQPPFVNLLVVESSFLLLLVCHRDEAVITIPASYTCKCSYKVCSKSLQFYDNLDNNYTNTAAFVKGIINHFRHPPLQFLRVRFLVASTCVHPSSGVGVLPLREFLQNLLV